jgi:GNAT superfamily N-acetyltransferase
MYNQVKMGDVMVRQATLQDLEVLLAFEQGIVAAERSFDSTLKKENIHYYDIATMISAPDVEVAVAVAGHEIIGSGYARIENAKVFLKHQRHAYLGFMYVLPSYRGAGVNMLIIEYLKQWCILQNINGLRLEVYHDNRQAIKAYEKVGFKKLMVAMRLGMDDK